MAEDYYVRLGLTQDASLSEIKTAYRSLALVLHPDKVPGKEEEFKLLQEAYSTLSDSEKRKRYDRSLSSLNDCLGFLDRLRRQGLKFRMVEFPERCDHYTYFNLIFYYQDSKDKRLIAGERILKHDTYWEMLNYVAYCLGRERDRLRSVHRQPTEKIKKHLQVIETNLTKIGFVVYVILGSDKRKRLYDLAMGFTDSVEMLEMERLIGGKEGLLHFINQQGAIDIAEGVFALRDAHCLTPANFKRFTSIKLSSNVLSLSLTLAHLCEVGILTQTTFDWLMSQNQHALSISHGVSRLKVGGILNNQYLKAVIDAGKQGQSLGCNLEGLQMAGLLNEENFKILVQKIFEKALYHPLHEMQNTGHLNKKNTSKVLLWKGPPELQALTHRLDQMIAYGVYLLSEDEVKGKTALLHGLELKKDLKDFFARSPKEQKENLHAFKESFRLKLHCKDHEMAMHRAQWKIIVANIAIALTGIGLIALGIQYMLTKKGFFADTHREQLIKKIDETPWSDLGSLELKLSLSN